MHINSYRIRLKSVYDVSHFQPPPHYGKEENAWGKSPDTGLEPKPLNIYIPHRITGGFLYGSAGKESSCNAGDTGDMGSISWSGRSPGGGNGNLLQYPCLKNPMERRAWLATVQRIEELNTAEGLSTQKTASSVKSGVLSNFITIIYWLIK